MSQDGKKRIQGTSPMHIVLIADDSESMEGAPAASVTEAIQEWILQLQQATRGKQPYFRFSLITFGTSADVVVEARSINDIDGSQLVIDGTSGSTNLTDALHQTRDILIRDQATSSHCPPFVFIYTDGHADDPREALQAAAQLKDAALPCGAPRVVTLGFGSVNDTFLKQVATSPEFYKRVPSADSLVRLLPAIGTPTRRGGNGTVADFERQISQAETNI